MLQDIFGRLMQCHFAREEIFLHGLEKVSGWARAFAPEAVLEKLAIEIRDVQMRRRLIFALQLRSLGGHDSRGLIRAKQGSADPKAPCQR